MAPPGLTFEHRAVFVREDLARTWNFRCGLLEVDGGVWPRGVCGRVTSPSLLDYQPARVSCKRLGSSGIAPFTLLRAVVLKHLA